MNLNSSQRRSTATRSPRTENQRIRYTAALLIGVAASASSSIALGADGGQVSPASLVDALHSAFGTHHARAVHAKGIILDGTFSPTPEARGVSKAILFSGGRIPVTVRFSDFTGIPDIPDTVGDANPRGFAVKFRLDDGSTTDIVTHSFNGFPTATSADFGDLLRAIGASGTDAPKPTALDKFLGSHPIAKTFLTTQKPAPVSYATLNYFGVNSFKFIDGKNGASYVRYRFVPKAGEQFLDAASLKTKGLNYLAEEITSRVAKSPIVYEWFAQVSGSGDAIADPSIAWPETRKLILLGTINIDRLARYQGTADKATLFLPGNLPSGIEPADPMIEIRSAAYPISFGARQ
jgi:catalase